jgi:hypothetical protein
MRAKYHFALSFCALILIGNVSATAAPKKPAPADAPILAAVPCVDPLNRIPIGCTPKPKPGGAEGVESGVMTALAKPFQDLANFIADDSAAAIALSTQIPDLQDGHGQQCWMATAKFGEVVKAHPVPVTLRAQTDLEALRMLAMAANNLCSNVHCTQVFSDLTVAIQTLAPVNASIPIPSLHDLCAKVPQVGVIPPIPVPPAPPPVVPPVTPATPNP